VKPPVVCRPVACVVVGVIVVGAGGGLGSVLLPGVGVFVDKGMAVSSGIRVTCRVSVGPVVLVVPVGCELIKVVRVCATDVVDVIV
jgi:hypothetical protein